MAAAIKSGNKSGVIGKSRNAQRRHKVRIVMVITCNPCCFVLNIQCASWKCGMWDSRLGRSLDPPHRDSTQPHLPPIRSHFLADKFHPPPHLRDELLTPQSFLRRQIRRSVISLNYGVLGRVWETIPSGHQPKLARQTPAPLALQAEHTSRRPRHGGD
jgi:hypothetical protein